jgi:hypothetical protein
MKSRIGLVLMLGLMLPALRAQERASPAKPEEVQRAIEKGLFFVEHRSMLWWRNRGCATCHEGQMLIVAANAAKDRGIAVDQENLDFWTDRWVLTDALATNEKSGKLNGLGMFTGPYFLFHRDRGRDTSEERAVKWAAVLTNAFEGQLADGRWAEESSHMTPRMALALADLEASSIPFTRDFRREMAQRRERTEEWIRTNEPQFPEKTESLAGWAVYERLRGDPLRAKRLIDELLSRRRDDGGWGIKQGDPSHLLVTSVVLYSLKSCGLPDDDPVIAGTQRYLLEKQSPDGRWRELGRHFHPEAYHSAYDVWTTGFAIAALSLTLPNLEPGSPRQFTPDAQLVAVVDQLRTTAANGYKGRTDRTGDPTEPDEQIVPKDK